ncbi:MAG: site-specific DNA-methyltransferase [Myxococcota bacterium]
MTDEGRGETTLFSDKLLAKMPATPDVNVERLRQLKALMPDLFTNDGAINPESLKRLVDADGAPDTERFEFRWFGKSCAKRRAFTPTVASLEYDAARSVNPERAGGNAIIEGENLQVLKCLLAGYRNRVKCIYIDPPYNKDKDFVYRDTWKQDKESYWEHIGVTQGGVKIDSNTRAEGRLHSNWLNMMYPRLLLARQLLRDDGVIFISIDDSEAHHLRKLCDEVFGEENFFAQIIIRANSRGQTYKQIAKTHEYIISYTKNQEAELMELVKAVMQHEQAYINFFEWVLTAETRELIDTSQLKPVPSEFVDPHQKLIADVVFRAPLRSGNGCERQRVSARRLLRSLRPRAGAQTGFGPWKTIFRWSTRAAPNA